MGDEDRRIRPPDPDRHQGRFVGFWATGDDIMLVERIRRFARLPSQSATLRYALERAAKFLKDDQG